MPRVTVVVPAYRAERWIEEALDSVLRQTYSDYEIIVVDDGSPDRTAEIVARYESDRLRLVRQSNLGVAAARNAGLAIARGEIWALLDADDAWEADKLERHVALLDERPEVDVTFSASAFVDELGHSVGPHRVPRHRAITPLGVLLRDPIGNGSNLVARRRAFEAAVLSSDGERPTYFDEDRQLAPSEDTEAWFRLSLAGATFAFIPRPLTRYRLHAGGGSAELDRKLASWEVLLRKVERRAPSVLAGNVSRVRAYQTIAVARRALMLHDTTSAARLLARALREHPSLVGEEMAMTSLTALGVAAQALLPRAVESRVRSTALRLRGAAQERAMRARSAGR